MLSALKGKRFTSGYLPTRGVLCFAPPGSVATFAANHAHSTRAVATFAL